MAAATGQAPSEKLLEWPKYDAVRAIKADGASLSALIPKFHDCFNSLIDSSNDFYKIGDKLDFFQDAIKCKTAYRLEKSKIPNWVYKILDILGIGSVAKAKQELNRQISKILDKVVKEKNQQFLEYCLNKIDIKDLKKHFNHEFFTNEKNNDLIRNILYNSYNWPVYSKINEISDGGSLASLISEYREGFNTYIDAKAYDFPRLAERLTCLQNGIRNKTRYRLEKSKIPTWIYTILDILGIGSVGRAKNEIHRQIKTILDFSFKNSDKFNNYDLEVISDYFEKIEVDYKKKHSSHEFFTKNKEKQAIQGILISAGVVKPDFAALLKQGQNDSKVLEEFKWKLKAFIKQDERGYRDKKLFDTLQYQINGKGSNYNLLQLMIYYKQFEFLLEMVRYAQGFLAKDCFYNITKEVMNQPFDHDGVKAKDLIELLAKCKGWNIKQLDPAQPYFLVEAGDDKDKELLAHLLSRANEINHPDRVYFLKQPEKLPDVSNREEVLKAAGAG